MQGNVKKDDFAGNEPEAVNARFSEALAAYLEQRNGEAVSPVAFQDFSDEDLRGALALLQLADKAAKMQPDINLAWHNFRAKSFDSAALATDPASLGGYVSGALETEQALALKQSGLPRETLEALRSDQTPLNELKDFELADYAALAKRYGVKDALFPRMLKWLKGLGKNFAAPNLGLGGSMQRGMAFAREKDYEQRVSEEYLAGELERQGQNQEVAEQKEKDEQAEKKEE